MEVNVTGLKINLEPQPDFMEMISVAMGQIGNIVSKVNTMSEEFDRVRAAVEESNSLMSSAVAGLTSMAEEVRRMADELAAAQADQAKLADLETKMRELATVADQGNDQLAAWVAANAPAPAPAPGEGEAPAPAPAPGEGEAPAPAPGEAPPPDAGPTDPAPTPPEGAAPEGDGTAPAPDGTDGGNTPRTGVNSMRARRTSF